VVVVLDVTSIEVDEMYAGGTSGSTGDNQHVIDDIHTMLMSYIREQPSTWAPVLSSVSVL